MTSTKKPELPRLIPTLSDEVKAECIGGVFEIKKPTLTTYKFEYHNQEPVDAIKLHCQSLYTRRPNEIHKCNSLIKTIIGHGTGTQTELIECGRCRTSYLITTKYAENGDIDIIVNIWDLGRNVKQYAEMKRDKKYKVWVSFNS